ncbi:M23 family metallopeptidase [Corynebacterium choanae]|uniref:M23 family metallopeptidase n=1 Tax=Corynebacterium choanae TaxID=1862358 RepID=UPI001FE505DB|nr:M23 family metallopeptidase [Corynebacterium choanae]
MSLSEGAVSSTLVYRADAAPGTTRVVQGGGWSQVPHRTVSWQARGVGRRRFVNPLTSRRDLPVVIRSFDPPAKRWLPGHRGVDLDAMVGAPIFAPAAGTVRFAAVLAGTPTVSIGHQGGLITSYQPVTAVVRRGEVVQQGQLIGVLSEPVTPFPGLSWGARFGQTYINPMWLLQPPHIRLKPAGSPPS